MGKNEKAGKSTLTSPGWRGGDNHPNSFATVKYPNIGIWPKISIFYAFVTNVNFKTIPRASPKLLNLNQDRS